MGLRSVSRGCRRTGDAFASGAVWTDGTGWAVDFSLRPRPLSSGRRRADRPASCTLPDAWAEFARDRDQYCSHRNLNRDFRVARPRIRLYCRPCASPRAQHRQPCLTATCYKWENGKSIVSIDTTQASIVHGPKTDLELARPPGGDHPAAQHASPGVLTRSAARRGGSASKHPSPNDSQ